MAKKSVKITGNGNGSTAHAIAAAPVMPLGIDLAAFRKQRAQVEVRVLPESRLSVSLRTVRLMDLVLLGEIPETLDGLVRKAQTAGIGINELKDLMPLVNVVVRACLVDPAIGNDPDETHVTLDELPVVDRLDIFSWANGGALTLQPFPGEPAGGVEPAPPGEGVQPAAE